MNNLMQIELYVAELVAQFNSGHAKEHAYRPALESLMSSFENAVNANDPKPYQPAQKWLKDRKGRKLTNEDIEHYQKIIKILV